MAKIIYLNGPSSSGKTTLAKALQDSFEEPFFHLGIDKIIGFMPAKMNNWEGGHAPLGFSWRTDTDAEGHCIFHVRAGPLEKGIVLTLKDEVILLALQYYNLIIDDVAFGTIEVEEWRQVLKDYNMLYVVSLLLEILEEGEGTCGNCCIGSARAQYYKVHENVANDLEVDRHAHSLEENVSKIKKALLNK